MAHASDVPARELAARLADHGIAASEAYGRPDLAARLRALEQHASGSLARVLVVGEFKQGKSSLVNALVGKDVSPVAPDAATVVPVAVGWGPTPVATAFVATDDGNAAESIDPGSLRDWVLERGAHTGDGRVRGVEVALPAPALRRGLVLVDFPGVGGLGSFTGVLALAALPAADAVLFVSDAAQALTAHEMAFLQRLARAGIPLALVKTRTDLHPDWRTVLDADTRQVASLTPAVCAVSADVAKKGRESGDADLVDESGVPPLVHWLDDNVVAVLERQRALRVTTAVDDVARTLATTFETERAALRSPADAAVRAEELARAQADAERLRSAAGRWQQVLVDAFADLSGDVDHQLRAASRAALAEAEQTIDTIDPARAWQEYEPQLRRTVAGLVADHYESLQTRLATATNLVANVFSNDAAAVEDLVQAARPDVAPHEYAAIDDAVAIGDIRRPGLGGQALVMLRSSYGGALMTAFLGGVIGLALATPAVLAVGAVLGAKGLREDNARRLAQRRAAARTAVRKLVDEVLFEVAKDSRDTVRLTQRRLRDFFVTRADELVRSATATLRAVQSARDEAATAHGTRLADIDAELARLAQLIEGCRLTHESIAPGRGDRS
jgi:hypothetical protein